MIILSGCKKETASDVVKEYLNNYQNVVSSVKSSINKTINEHKEFSTNHKKIYYKILINQYKTLKYTILSEEYDDDKAIIKVRINVNNLYNADNNSMNYLSKNLSEFYNEKNEFDQDKYITYKLNLMLNTKDRVDYDIVFFLNYKNKRWILKNPTESDLEKIHGIYKE